MTLPNDLFQGFNRQAYRPGQRRLTPLHETKAFQDTLLVSGIGVIGAAADMIDFTGKPYTLFPFSNTFNLKRNDPVGKRQQEIIPIGVERHAGEGPTFAFDPVPIAR